MPARRMRSLLRQAICLCLQLCSLLQRLALHKASDFASSNRSNGNNLAQEGLSSVLRRMFKVKDRGHGYGGLTTVHVLCGTFKTWVTEKTDADWLTGEVALANKIGNHLSAAYQKGHLIEKRRYLM